jgi:hypothetical protein
MNDLVSMLKDAGMGIGKASEMINCLLFADDIVLIDKTEEEQQSLLTIAGIFASKWNMKFNASKSKVMVIGKLLTPTINLSWKCCMDAIRFIFQRYARNVAV